MTDEVKKQTIDDDTYEALKEADANGDGHITKEELAKTGDSTKYMMTAEYCLVVNNPDAHAKVQGVGA